MWQRGHMSQPQSTDRPAVRVGAIMVCGILAAVCFLVGMRSFGDGRMLRGLAASAGAGFAAAMALRLARGERGGALLSLATLAQRRRRPDR